MQRGDPIWAVLGPRETPEDGQRRGGMAAGSGEHGGGSSGRKNRLNRSRIEPGGVEEATWLTCFDYAATGKEITGGEGELGWWRGTRA